MYKLTLYKRIWYVFTMFWEEEGYVLPCATVFRALWYCTFNRIPTPYTLCATPNCTLILRYTDAQNTKLVVEFTEFCTLKTVILENKNDIIQR